MLSRADFRKGNWGGLISQDRVEHLGLLQRQSYFDMPPLRTKQSLGAEETSHLPYPAGGTTDIFENDLNHPR